MMLTNGKQACYQDLTKGLKTQFQGTLELGLETKTLTRRV